MRCKYCKKKIRQTGVTNVWYHVKPATVHCYPKFVATPKKKHLKKVTND